MALRLMNRHTHPLRIDLRGGVALVLAPGQRSEALREELLYDNCNLQQWERAGWIARLPARFADVGKGHKAVAKKVAKKAVKKAAKKSAKKAAKKVAKKVAKKSAKKATQSARAAKAASLAHWPSTSRSQ